MCYNVGVGPVAHLVERSIRIAEVVGSSPIWSTKYPLCLLIVRLTSVE